MTDYSALAAQRAHFVYGVPIVESWEIPRGKLRIEGGRIFAHPSVAMVMNVGRTPLWTRHMPGVIEAERDQRRRRKGRWSR